MFELTSIDGARRIWMAPSPKERDQWIHAIHVAMEGQRDDSITDKDICQWSQLKCILSVIYSDLTSSHHFDELNREWGSARYIYSFFSKTEPRWAQPKLFRFSHPGHSCKIKLDTESCHQEMVQPVQ